MTFYNFSSVFAQTLKKDRITELHAGQTIPLTSEQSYLQQGHFLTNTLSSTFSTAFPSLASNTNASPFRSKYFANPTGQSLHHSSFGMAHDDSHSSGLKKYLRPSGSIAMPHPAGKNEFGSYGSCTIFGNMGWIDGFVGFCELDASSEGEHARQSRRFDAGFDFGFDSDAAASAGWFAASLPAKGAISGVVPWQRSQTNKPQNSHLKHLAGCRRRWQMAHSCMMEVSVFLRIRRRSEASWEETIGISRENDFAEQRTTRGSC